MASTDILGVNPGENLNLFFYETSVPTGITITSATIRIAIDEATAPFVTQTITTSNTATGLITNSANAATLKFTFLVAATTAWNDKLPYLVYSVETINSNSDHKFVVPFGRLVVLPVA